jgi:hypothetical protein
MLHPVLAIFNLGGAQIILILVITLILTLGAAAAVIVIAYLATGASRKQAGAAPPALSAQPSDIEQQLRTLAKLRDDGVINEEDFNAKKKALLGI